MDLPPRGPGVSRVMGACATKPKELMDSGARSGRVSPSMIDPRTSPSPQLSLRRLHLDDPSGAPPSPGYGLHDSGEALFDTTVCADDVSEYKPEPEMLQRALTDIGELAGDHVWYVADSMVDMQAARNAGIAGVFYNGGFWEVPALRLAFSGYKPRAVIASFEELFETILWAA